MIGTAAAVQSGLAWQAWGRERTVQSSKFLSRELLTVPRFSQAYDSLEGKSSQKKWKSGVGLSSGNTVPSHSQLG